MATKKLSRRKFVGQNSWQDLTLSSFIPQVEKTKKQTYLHIVQTTTQVMIMIIDNNIYYKQFFYLKD